MADNYKVAIIVTATDEASVEIKRLGKGLGELDKESKKAKVSTGAIGKDLKALGKSAMAGVASIAAVGFAMKKAFDLGKEGAAIQQTEESFEGLLKRIGAAPDLLDDLRSASRGTVSDLDLMASTTTLLAGAQGELATQLAAATPELMEIAKAANKLNPTLGDTTFLYQSLATGIKRASPLILDNLGLTIKVGEANERYAESIGKTVDQLSAEEQKLALLNEARRAGKVLIDQAGGAAESATDDFERLEATIENVSNAFKKSLAPAIADAATALLDWIAISEKEQDAIDRSKELAETQAKTADEYAKLVRERLILEGILEGETREAMETRLAIVKDGNIAIVNYANQTIRKDREWVASRIAANKRAGRSTQELEKRYDELTQKLEDTATSVIELDWATTELGAAQKEQHDELEALVQSYDRADDAINIFGDETTAAGIAARKARGAIEEETEALTGLGVGLHAIGPKLDYAIDREQALIDVGLRAAAAQQLLDDSLSDLGIAVRGIVGRQLEDFTETEAGLVEQTTTAREELAELEDQLRTMPRGGGIAGLRADLVGIEGEMHELGPEPEKLNREREAVMRGLEVAHLEASEALKEQQAAAGAYVSTTEKVADLKAEIADLEEQMRDAQQAHQEETESIIYSLAEQSIDAMDLVKEMGQPAVDLQWALAEAMGQIDQKTLQTWNATQRINELYADQVITLDEAVALYEELATIAAKPIEIAGPAEAVEGGFGYYDWERERAALEESGLPEGMQVLFDEIETARETAIPEVIESEIIVENLDTTLEAFKVMETITRYISGPHNVIFELKTRGAWPGMGGGGDGNGGPPPGGAGRGGPGTPYDRYQTGGIVAETGLAYVHAGELIIPPMEAQQIQAEGGGTTVTHGDTHHYNLNVTSVQELTSLMQEFELMRALAG